MDLSNLNIINAKEFFLGQDEWVFLFEVIVRCFISFVIVLFALRLTG